MFNHGDFIEVKDRGHLVRITRMDREKVWVEWEHRPGIAYDYCKHCNHRMSYKHLSSKKN